MATTTIQHPTLDRVVYDVPDGAVSDWTSAGWTVLTDPDSEDETPAAAEGAEAEPATAPAATAGPFTDTQGSDSPPDTPATGGSTKTTRKAV